MSSKSIPLFNDLSRSTTSLLLKIPYNSVVSSVFLLHLKCIPFIISFSAENFCLANLYLSTPIHNQPWPEPESPPVNFFPAVYTWILHSLSIACPRISVFLMPCLLLNIFGLLRYYIFEIVVMVADVFCLCCWNKDKQRIFQNCKFFWANGGVRYPFTECQHHLVCEIISFWRKN